MLKKRIVIILFTLEHDLAGMLADFIFFPTTDLITTTSNEILCQAVAITTDTIVEENEYFNITLTSSDSVVLVGGPCNSNHHS